MAKSKKKWVALSTDQLLLESNTSSDKMVGDNLIHCAEPIPDHDWVGGTWGLYWSDYEDELRELLEEDTDKYITIYPEDKVSPQVVEVEILSSPTKEKTPEIDAHPPMQCHLLEEWIQDSLGEVNVFYDSKVNASICLHNNTNLEIVKVSPPREIVEPSPPDLKIHPPLQHSALDACVQEPLGSIDVLDYEKEDPMEYLTTSNQKPSANKVCVNTVTASKCPENLNLDINLPIEPSHVAACVIGTLGVVLGFEYKEEDATKFWKTHKEDEMRGFKLSIQMLKSLTCPDEAKVSLSPPPSDFPKLPDNALHIQLEVGACNLENVGHNNNAKWGWIRSGERSAGRAKHGLSMFW